MLWLCDGNGILIKVFIQNLKDYYENKGFVMSAVKHLKGSLSSEGITVNTDLPPNGKWKVAKLGNYQKVCEQFL